MDDNGLSARYEFWTRNLNYSLTFGDKIDETTQGVTLTLDIDWSITQWNIDPDGSHPTVIQFTRPDDAFMAGPYLTKLSIATVKNGFKIYYAELSYGKIEDQIKFNINYCDQNNSYHIINEYKNPKSTLLYSEDDKTVYFTELDSDKMPDYARIYMLPRQ